MSEHSATDFQGTRKRSRSRPDLLTDDGGGIPIDDVALRLACFMNYTAAGRHMALSGE